MWNRVIGLALLIASWPLVVEANPRERVTEVLNRQIDALRSDCVDRGGARYVVHPLDDIPNFSVILVNRCVDVFVSFDEIIKIGIYKTVFKAYHFPDWKPVVRAMHRMKLALQAKPLSPEALAELESFKREIRFSKLIRELPLQERRGLPEFLAVDEDEIISPFLGENASTWRREMTVDAPPKVLEAVIAAGRAILQLHRLGIVHGDVKPSNIMMGGVSPVLIDFGQSYFAHEVVEDWVRRRRESQSFDPIYVIRPRQDPGYASAAKLTKGGIEAQWLDYAIEDLVQHQNEMIENEFRTDLYSLAVSAVELLDGCAPREGLRLSQDLHEQLTESVLSRLQIRIKKGSQLAGVLRRAIEQGPDGLSNLESFLLELEGLSERNFEVEPCTLSWDNICQIRGYCDWEDLEKSTKIADASSYESANNSILGGTQ